MKILIIDDDKSDRQKAIQAVLAVFPDAEIVEANSLQKVEKLAFDTCWGFDIVVSDVNYSYDSTPTFPTAHHTFQYLWRSGITTENFILMSSERPKQLEDWKEIFGFQHFVLKRTKTFQDDMQAALLSFA